jgi:hypothetical protein
MDRSSRRPHFRLPHKFGEPVEKWPLAYTNLCMGRWRLKPLGAIDLGKTLHPSTFGGHSISNVLLLTAWTLRLPSTANAITTLANFAERFKRFGESEAGLLHKFSARGHLGLFAVVDLALRDRPGPLIVFRQ